MISALKQPFPRSEISSLRWQGALLAGFIVFACLFTFRPFVIYRFETPAILWMTGGYGLITFVVIVLIQHLSVYLLPGLFAEEKWTAGKEVLFILFVICCIAAACGYYSLNILDKLVNVQDLIRFQLFLLVASLPVVTLIVLFIQAVLVRRNVKAAIELCAKMHFKQRLEASPGAEILLRSEDGDQELKIPVSDLVFIVGEKDHIVIHYIAEGREREKRMSGTVRGARDAIRQYTAFYRCHRSYIVNLDRVELVGANSQGFTLKLKGSKQLIPVSSQLRQEVEVRLSK